LSCFSPCVPLGILAVAALCMQVEHIVKLAQSKSDKRSERRARRENQPPSGQKACIICWRCLFADASSTRSLCPSIVVHMGLSDFTMGGHVVQCMFREEHRFIHGNIGGRLPGRTLLDTSSPQYPERPERVPLGLGLPTRTLAEGPFGSAYLDNSSGSPFTVRGKAKRHPFRSAFNTINCSLESSEF
jgi:hypothetical protein